MTAYLDNAATTAVCKEAADAALDAMINNFGNPSSTHTLGRAAAKILDSSRKTISAALSALPEELFFTSGGTEADNWAILETAELMRHRGHHAITTSIEHDAVRRSFKRLEALGWDVTWLSPEPDGSIALEKFAAAIRSDTMLVSMMLVNNETGSILPVKECAALLKKANPGAIFHTDAVQAFLKVPFSVKNLGVDLLSISGHKIHAPKGIGALWIKRSLRLPGFITGGGQERGLRAGTEAMPQIAAFGAAVKAAYPACSVYQENMAHLRRLCIDRLRETIPEAEIIGGGAPHILCLSLPGYKSEVLMNYLESKEIYVSKSSACKRGARSHVLEAMALPASVIDGAIRVSFSRFSTEEEIEYFCQNLLEAKNTLFKVLR